MKLREILNRFSKNKEDLERFIENTSEKIDVHEEVIKVLKEDNNVAKRSLKMIKKILGE